MILKLCVLHKTCLRNLLLHIAFNSTKCNIFLNVKKEFIMNLSLFLQTGLSHRNVWRSVSYCLKGFNLLFVEVADCLKMKLVGFFYIDEINFKDHDAVSSIFTLAT